MRRNNTITALGQSSESSSISRQLIDSVRNQSSQRWIDPSDVKCVICSDTIKDPVTTPCGHSYCRACLDRAMSYRLKCALCSASLSEFNLEEASDNLFLKSLLSSMEEDLRSEDPMVIPIITCYVAFPGMPCPLFIFQPKYWQMVRRVTDSGSRKFGMLAYEEGSAFAEYGTIMEICDCVVLEDNRCFLSTIGVSRFKVIKRFEEGGCNLARVVILRDILPNTDDIIEIHVLDCRLLSKASEWLKNLDRSVQEKIETEFGLLPYLDTQESWWETADGPLWIWWLINILPVRPDIKVLMISTKSLLKRMSALSRTFDAIKMELESREDTFQTIREAHEPTNSIWSIEDIE